MTELFKNIRIRYFSLGLLSIIFFYLSINYSEGETTFFYVFKKFTSDLNAYFLDQLLFLFIFFITFIIAFAKRIITISVWSIFVFSLILTITLVFQNEVLTKYFIKEDYSLLLKNLNTALINPNFNLYSVDFFKSYPYVSFAILFKLFGTDAFYYNLASLILMALGAALLYNLLSLLIPTSRLAIKVFSLLVVLIYLISPVTMEIYVWVQGGHANGYIISGLILSTYFYIKFIQSKKILFFILSFLLVLFLLKTSLVRSALWPVCLVFLDFIYLQKKKAAWLNFSYRAGLLLIPMALAIQPFLAISPSQNQYSILERLYIFFSNITPSIIPFQFYLPSYKFILSFLEINGINSGIIYDNIFFISGIFLFLLISITTLIAQKKGEQGRIILFFWFCSISYLCFFSFLGSWGLPDKGSIDKSIINYAMVPSSRYYTFTFLFLIITIYLQYFTSRKTSGKIYFSTAILIIILISNINVTQFIQRDLNSTGAIPLKVVSENILGMVPDIRTPQVLYSINGAPKVVQSFGYDGFSALFRYPPVNLYSEEELINYLSNNHIKINNIFAYTFNENSLNFQNKSLEVRKKFKSYLY